MFWGDKIKINPRLIHGGVSNLQYFDFSEWLARPFERRVLSRARPNRCHARLARLDYSTLSKRRFSGAGSFLLNYLVTNFTSGSSDCKMAKVLFLSFSFPKS